MKHLTFVAAIVLLCLAVAGIARAESGNQVFCVVKISEFRGNPTLTVLTEPELREMEKTLSAEGRVLDRACRESSKEWSAKKENASKRFPFTSLSPRKMTFMGRYSDSSKAQEKLSAIRKKEEEDSKAAQKKEDERNKGRSAEQIAKEKAKDSQKEADMEEALRLVRERIKALSDELTSKSAPAAPAGKNDADGKNMDRPIPVL